MAKQVVTGQVFVDREPTRGELEIIRLMLSTYQDGFGQLKTASGTLPGWRDFERTISEIANGKCTEDKSIFDVLVTRPKSKALVGLSCKMRKELSRVDRDGRTTIELTNSSKKMWQALEKQGITIGSYKSYAAEVGTALVGLVKEWHGAAATYRGQTIDMSRSSYLTLLWNQKTRMYRLFRFALALPDPSTLKWYFPASSGGSSATGRHLNGDDSKGHLFEWYGESGGQLKYYPLAENAIWNCPAFRLEPLPKGCASTVAQKAASYFPKLWAQAKD